MAKKHRQEAPPENGPSCANCMHWREKTEAQDEVRWGLCHRYPPIPAPSVDSKGSPTIECVVSWTELPHECGEFKQRLAS